ncbi:MAG TPA: hypothetical protein VLW25_09485 [Bryobacteraceae bacterium]|nr:hypothetical protein [Bryobacteraceae bacterium]
MSRLKRFAWFIAGLTAVALVVTLGTENRAIAQAVRAALVRNQDEPGRNPYFETRGDSVCASGACSLTFSAVPAGQRLVVTFVSTGYSSFAPPPSFVILETPNKHVQWFQTFQTDSTSSYMSSPVVAYYEAGETPVLLCGVAGGSSGLSGTLSGYYISLP